MKKFSIILGILWSNYLLMAQTPYETPAYGTIGIGIDETNSWDGKPYATLHIQGIANSEKEGLLIPRLNLYTELYKKNLDVYGNNQIGTLVYIYNVQDHLPRDRRLSLIYRDGFYYWGGQRWIPLYQRRTIEINNPLEPISSTGIDKGTQFLETPPVFTSDDEKQQMAGASYYNTKENILYIYNGKEWIKSISFEPPN